MSYILEALRRSQAERERGRVPGLDAQPAPGEAAHGAGRGLPLTWLASGLGLLLFLGAIVAAGWWTRQSPPARLAQGGPAVPAIAPSPALTTALPMPAPTTPRPPPALDTAAATPRLPQVVSVPPAALETPPVPAAPPAPLAAPAPPQPPRTLTLAQLSAGQRRELPAMVVGGSIWSDSAASRFVIINGQVVREGEAAADGVILERVGPKSATLRWRDLKIELPL